MAAGHKSGFTLDSIRDEKTYSDRVCVRVIKIEESALSSTIRGSVADATGWVKVHVSPKHKSMFVAGRSLALRGFTFHDGIVQVKERTSVYRSAPVVVSEELVQLAQTGLSKPVHQYKLIEEVMKDGEKRKLSIKGIIVTNHQEQTIRTKQGEEIKKREIQVQDQSGTINATIWREACSVDIQVGDEILLKDVVASFSAYHKMVTVSVNFPYSIEICSNDEPQDMALVAIQNEDLEERLSVLVKVGDVERDATVSWKRLAEFLKVDENIPMDEVLQLLPLNLRAKVKQNEIVDFE